MTCKAGNKFLRLDATYRPGRAQLSHSQLSDQAGVGHFILNDFDVVDKSNLQRQIVYQEASESMNNAESSKQILQRLNSDNNIEAISEKTHRKAMLEHNTGCYECVDGKDNFASWHLIIVKSLFSGKPLVSGAAIQMEGQVSVFNGETDNPCYAWLYGSDNTENNMICSENGVLAPQADIIRSIQVL